jgi:hypothetical protein
MCDAIGQWVHRGAHRATALLTISAAMIKHAEVGKRGKEFLDEIRRQPGLD